VRLPKIHFSKWSHWSDFFTPKDGVQFPGVYLVAHFDRPPRGPARTAAREIVHIGETCNNNLRGRQEHSGGMRYYKKFRNKKKYKRLLHVAVFPVNVPKKGIRPFFVRYVERKLLLDYAIRWGKAPKCNEK
jgi:hypothetical protein